MHGYKHVVHIQSCMYICIHGMFTHVYTSTAICVYHYIRHIYLAVHFQVCNKNGSLIKYSVFVM